VAIVEVNGVRLAYDRHDDGAAGPVVVFLHAFPLNRAMWEPQLEDLGGVYDVIMPDLRGFGASDVTEGVLSMDGFADDLHAFVESLELAPITLVGISMGGYVALSYAKKYPDELRALVLVDTRSSADGEDARAGRYEMIEEVAANGPAAIAEQMLPKLLSERATTDNPTLVVDVRRMIETTAAGSIAGALAGMAEREDSTAVLPTISVPTLVIVGENDVVTPPEAAREMASAIPSARLEVLEGAGHLSNLERPDAFNAVLREFLDSLDGEA
jgi:3-oxoadipate enol-lactonase